MSLRSDVNVLRDRFGLALRDLTEDEGKRLGVNLNLGYPRQKDSDPLVDGVMGKRPFRQGMATAGALICGGTALALALKRAPGKSYLIAMPIAAAVSGVSAFAVSKLRDQHNGNVVEAMMRLPPDSTFGQLRRTAVPSAPTASRPEGD